jgi:hypothetical protein
MITRYVDSSPRVHNSLSPTIQSNPISDTNCNVLVIRQGVWIDN